MPIIADPGPLLLLCRWQRPDLLEQLELVEVEALRGDLAVADLLDADVAKRHAIAAGRNVTLRAAEGAGVGAAQRALGHDRVAGGDLVLGADLSVRQRLPEAPDYLDDLLR